MKRKIGELRNVPIVEGDKNLVREGTEIHINDLQSKGSSGGGEGVKEYYYKIITDNQEMLAMIAALAGMSSVTSALYKRYDGKIVKLNGYVTQDAGIVNAASFIMNGIGFAITSESYTALQAHEDYIQITVSSGDFFDKAKSAGIDDQTLEMLNSCIQEITKEEYESLITQ